jgi:hypothetical protein
LIYLFLIVFFLFKKKSIAIEDSSEFKNEILEDSFCEDSEDILDNFFEKKILTTSNLDNLYAINILNENQILDIKNHVEKYGFFLSKYELQLIPSLSKKDIDEILKYFDIEEIEDDYSSKVRENYFDIFSRTLYPCPEKFQIKENDLFASEFTLRNKIKVKNSEFGIFLKKGFGESFIFDQKTKRYGFNSYRFYFLQKKLFFFKKILLGSFQVESGQGLIFGSSFFIKKSSEAVKILKVSNLGISAYKSLNQINLFGIGAEFDISSINFKIFFSKVFLDHKIDTENEIFDFVKSNPNRKSEYFNEKVLENRNNQTENVLACIISFLSKDGHFEVGLNNAIFHYKYPHISKKSDIYDFSGNLLFSQSIFFRYLIKNIHFFGEFAYTKNISNKIHTKQKTIVFPALISGFLYSLTRKFDVAFALRYYSPGFSSFFANCLCENSKPKNEFGSYFGILFKPKYFIDINFFYDFSKKLLHFENEDPFVHHFLFEFKYNLNKIYFFVFRYTQKYKTEKNSKENINFFKGEFSKAVKNNFKSQFIYLISKNFKIKTEFNFSLFSKESFKSKGYGIFQDLIFKIKKIKISNRTGFF